MFRYRQRRSMRLLALLAALALASIGSPAMAADGERPKIGVAFAGGGAKGIAHIGVLKVLEDMNIPIDYAAGTSMGSIIGGLYAAGMTPEEMRLAIAGIDWEDAMKDAPPRKDLSFRRKEDDRRYLFDLELGIKNWRIKAPAGLKSGQKLYFHLQSLTLNVADIERFDDLPTPFRAVATDIKTGGPVVLDGPNLARAMRASMAIPTVFTPVEIDGRLLVDGGIVNNVPVDVVRAMGADVVIAIDLGAPLESRNVGSFFQVYAQTMRMLTRRNMEPQLADADIVVVPPGVSAFSTLDFSAVEAIYKVGIEGALEQAEALRKLSVSPEEYQRFQATREAPPEPSGVIDVIRVEGNERVDTRVITGVLRQEPGDPLDLNLVFEDVSAVYGLGDFEQVYFDIQKEGEQVELILRTVEKSWGPHYLRFGASLSSDLQGEFDAAFLVNVTSTRLNSRGAEWRNDLQLGRRRIVHSEFYQPLDFRTHWFVAPAILYEANRIRYWREGRPVAELNTHELGGAFDFGYQFGRFGEARLGIERQIGDFTLESGALPPEIVEQLGNDIDLAGVHTIFQADRLNDANIPTDGYIGRLESFYSIESLGADAAYHKLGGSWGQWESRGRHTMFGTLDGGWSPGGELPVWDQFKLGGFFSFSGLEEGQLRGDYLAVARLGYYYRIRAKAFLGGWAEAGNVWQTSDEVDISDLIYTGTVFLGTGTFFGPLYLAWGWADIGQSRIYVTLGRTF